MVLSIRTFGRAGVLLAFLFVATGCDQIETVKNYFTGSNEKKPASSIAAQTGTQEKAQPNAVKPPMKGDALARVGNWSITVDEFNQRLSALKEVIPEYDTNDIEARKLVLDELVNQQILVIGAEKSGLAKQNDITAAVDEFRRTLIVREVARQLTENIKVTDEEARQFYEKNKDALIGPAQWRVREIVVPTKDQATTILSQILTGADFSEMAKLHSKGKTAQNGGDLGFITDEPFPQMGSAILALELGGVSGVFKGPDGYYIVKLEDKKEGEVLGFEEIKEDIIQNQTLLKQQEAILGQLDRLKKQINVEVNENLL